MTYPVYILSASAISPQHALDPDKFLAPPAHTADGQLFITDADYTRYIDPVAIRRMSRLLKMSISTGIQCLRDAGIDQPEAIITGTGRGSMNDTERFLTDMISLREEALNPTFFIQSTYNSTNGWLAMKTQCTGYNQTYVHRGASFELALLDAQMLLREGTVRYALTGCFDELTRDYFFVKNKIHYWKKDQPDSLDLLRHSHTPGTIAGEGSAFFLLSSQKERAAAILQSLTILNDPDPATIREQVENMLHSCGLRFQDIDIVLTGMNGDCRQQYIYDAVLPAVPAAATIAAFKHLCGEYDTAGGFGLWLATHMLRTQEIPALTICRKGAAEGIKHILLFNHYVLNNVSAMVISMPT